MPDLPPTVEELILEYERVCDDLIERDALCRALAESLDGVMPFVCMGPQNPLWGSAGDALERARAAGVLNPPSPETS